MKYYVIGKIFYFEIFVRRYEALRNSKNTRKKVKFDETFYALEIHAFCGFRKWNCSYL